jgi:putative ABC transport system substrate-binding protein
MARRGTVNRREFVTLLGGSAATWPGTASAQQPAMPVVGVLSPQSLTSAAPSLDAFRRGLAETGYADGQNVTIDYRLTEGRYDRLADEAADLVRRQASVIATPGNLAAALSAKAATRTIPIVFGVNDDPVKLGLVSSLARPGGNATGINFFAAELAAKRLEFLRELVPNAARLALLLNPANASTAASTLKDIEPTARALGMQFQSYNAGTSREVDAVFAALVREGADALFVAPDAFFTTRRVQLVHLATRHAIAAAYSNRQFVEVGGLISYGTSLTDMYRQVGIYTGRILKGAKPADLPVVQASKFELVVNAQTARLIGLTVPDKLFVAADEVIE